MTNGWDVHTNASVPLLRSAHAGAWLIQRMAAGHVDPAEHTGWLAEVISDQRRRRNSLRNAYLHRMRSP